MSDVTKSPEDHPHKAVFPGEEHIDVKAQAGAQKVSRQPAAPDEADLISAFSKKLKQLKSTEAHRVTAYLAEKFKVTEG